MLDLARRRNRVMVEDDREEKRVTRNVELPADEFERFDAAVDRLGMLQKEVVARMLKWFLDLPAPEQNAIMHAETAKPPPGAPKPKLGLRRGGQPAD